MAKSARIVNRRTESSIARTHPRVRRIVIDADGRASPAAQIASPNCDERPDDTAISLIVVHGISLPPGEFGGDGIERLFTNRLDPAAHPYYATIAALRVSSHFLIRRHGGLLQFVPCRLRAWHAGESAWRGRSGCNDFSIGIELEGVDATPSRTSPATATLRRGARPTLDWHSTGRGSGGRFDSIMARCYRILWP